MITKTAAAYAALASKYEGEAQELAESASEACQFNGRGNMADAADLASKAALCASKAWAFVRRLADGGHAAVPPFTYADDMAEQKAAAIAASRSAAVTAELVASVAAADPDKV